MNRDIKQFENIDFDIVIIGGGITGACLAHDASLRGMRVALVEKDDFGMSTSSASSKLLHGGIRYLQKLQFGKVRESARERMYFQKIAPHITSYVPFLIPTVKEDIMRGKLALSSGMLLYRFLCCGLNSIVSDPAKKFTHGKLYKKDKVLQWIPTLKALTEINGAHSLFETHMFNSERMTLAFIKTAIQHRAIIANHCEVVDFIKEDKAIKGVVAYDKINNVQFSVSGRMVVNAAGPFLPGLNSKIKGLNLHKNTTGFSKGVHLVIRQIEKKYALALSSGKKTEGLITRGGRHIFIIPWRNHSLIGTTNVPFTERPEDVRVTKKDIDDFLQDINAILPGLSLDKNDVVYAFSGLYPLVSENIQTDTYQGTGEYQVVDHAKQDGIEGIVSVLGAKYTTARVLAEYATDIIIKKFEKKYPTCQTGSAPLFEGRIKDLETYRKEITKQYKDKFDSATIEHLLTSHGSNLENVMEFILSKSDFQEKVSAQRETLIGEIAYAVEHEMACTLNDVVFARTGLGTIGHPGEDVLDKIVKIMADILDWSEEDCSKERESVNRKYQYI
ncbi:MAG: glycerol-3-phosphate dehydrogenase/oxidase [Desulfobacteraceae bacterium]|nr:glycerol-3-phosphate dehydrogenase/oxidase [Desulfobacteraceae bacterium]